MSAIVWLSLIVLAGPAEAATTPERVSRDFALANELALKGERESAIRLYENLLQQGVLHPDLYLNLGNAYAESKREVDAVISYERGLRLAPGDEDLQKNLELVRRRLEGKSEKPAPERAGEVSLADVMEPVVAPVPLEPFSWGLILANAALFGAWIARRRAHGEGLRKVLAAVVAASSLALAACGAVVLGHYVLARDPRAVAREASDLKEGPHERFQNKGRVPAGARVRVLEEDGVFWRVLREDGSTGWVRAQTLTRV